MHTIHDLGSKNVHVLQLVITDAHHDSTANATVPCHAGRLVL